MLRHLPTALALALFLLLASDAPADEKTTTPPADADKTASPEEPEKIRWVSSVRLLTIGPGDHLWTRFGHSALLVYRCPQQPGSNPPRCDPNSKKYESVVFNYGDADFEDPAFEYEFMRGTVKFRISSTGDLSQTVTRYARDNRTVIHQMVNLTPRQVDEVVRRLQENIKPQNRYYPYHHLRSGCATKIRDLLDEVLGGAIRRQFADVPDPMTPRYYGRQVFAGHLPAEIFNDLFMGRLHDRKWSKWEAMCVPARLSQYLGEVKVPDPDGGEGKVSLLGEPSTLYKRRGPPPTAGQGRTLIHLFYLGIVVNLGLGIWAFFGSPRAPRRAGVWVLLWALPMSIYAIIAMIGALASTVAEGRITELMLVWPITDLVLVRLGWRWLRGRFYASRGIRIYLGVRLAVLAMVLVGHAAGLLFQEPRVVLVLAAVCLPLLLLILRRVPFDQNELSHARD